MTVVSCLSGSFPENLTQHSLFVKSLMGLGDHKAAMFIYLLQRSQVQSLDSSPTDVSLPAGKAVHGDHGPDRAHDQARIRSRRPKRHRRPDRSHQAANQRSYRSCTSYQKEAVCQHFLQSVTALTLWQKIRRCPSPATGLDHPGRPDPERWSALPTHLCG